MQRPNVKLRPHSTARRQIRLRCVTLVRGQIHKKSAARWAVERMSWEIHVIRVRAESPPPAGVAIEDHWSEADAVVVASGRHVVESPLE